MKRRAPYIFDPSASCISLNASSTSSIIRQLPGLKNSGKRKQAIAVLRSKAPKEYSIEHLWINLLNRCLSFLEYLCGHISKQVFSESWKNQFAVEYDGYYLWWDQSISCKNDVTKVFDFHGLYIILSLKSHLSKEQNNLVLQFTQ